VYRPYLPTLPPQVLRLEVAVAQHARQAGGQQPSSSPLGRLNDVLGHDALVPAVEEVDRRPHPGIGVVPTHPGRIRKWRRDGHTAKFGHQPAEYIRAAYGYARRVPVQHSTAGPELLGVHSQRTDADHRRDRPRTREPALGQPGLHRDARHGPSLIGTSLDHDVPATSQPQTEHHRDLLQLEQHASGFPTQMIQTPSRQPARQIAQRHTQDCAIGTERTGREVRLQDDHRTFATRGGISSGV
jgi:hypothetical protein